jgi:acetoin utilization deacetylase AcuC-like enzyme
MGLDMKVVYDKKYTIVYSSDPASASGRMESIYDVLCGHYEFVKSDPANEEDLKLAHWKDHVDYVKNNHTLYQVARLAAGGAIKAAELAVQGEPSFGLIRPPGHHASKNSSWGFCYFNNIAISVERLRHERQIKKAFILDIDLHFGDGTANIFANNSDIFYFHPEANNREEYLKEVSKGLASRRECDIIAVSAGFDRHEQDWGGMLKTIDYFTIGEMIKQFAEEVCEGRRFAVLEGGYNHTVLGLNVESLLEGIA